MPFKARGSSNYASPSVSQSAKRPRIVELWRMQIRRPDAPVVVLRQRWKRQIRAARAQLSRQASQRASRTCTWDSGSARRRRRSCNPSAPLSRYRRPATAVDDASRIKHVRGRRRAPAISSLDTPSPGPAVQPAVSVRIAGLTCRDALVAFFDPEIATIWYMVRQIGTVWWR